MRLSRSLARGAVAALTMLILAACHRSDSIVCVPPPVVTPGPIVIPTLVSPASGATNVSTGPLDVTIGNASAANLLYLHDPGGNFVGSTNFREANPPSPDVRIGTFAQLASQTTYQLYANVVLPSGNFNPCGIH
ncbi:MAG: hypothetical protein M3154_06850, partial [Candidatus Eremiobacteraeota bacterium]|nr:hypothetical protein [Candidatus Eremiobacteraeota bacterium]